MSEGPESDSFRSATQDASRITVFLASCAALAVVAHGLLQLDLPITRYVRSVTIQVPGDQLIVPWMAFASDLGNWVGEGSWLILFSLVLLAVGWGFSKPGIKAAAVDTLLAHGLAALLSNGLKHLIGRPRPKFVHSGEWQVAPSLTSGWDSFPSGHTAATFAVATVLAKRFPVSSVIALGFAGFVGMSRILRGSHFPTDVFGGAVVGVLSGSVAAAPWREWRRSLREGLSQAAIGSTALFSLIWVLARPAEAGMHAALFIGLGVAALAGGAWLRIGRWRRADHDPAGFRGRASRACLAYGLACLTTSPMILSTVGLACLAYWFSDGTDRMNREPASFFRQALVDGGLAVGIALTALILVAGRGALPFR